MSFGFKELQDNETNARGYDDWACGGKKYIQNFGATLLAS
jgi:hypothetical protein